MGLLYKGYTDVDNICYKQTIPGRGNVNGYSIHGCN